MVLLLKEATLLRQCTSGPSSAPLPLRYSKQKPDYFTGVPKLYEERQDKDWSLTDCIAFAVMRDRGMYEALAHDKDFEQAGFNALLRE